MKYQRFHYLPNKYQRNPVGGSILAKNLEEAKTLLANVLPQISLWTWNDEEEKWNLEHGENPEP